CREPDTPSGHRDIRVAEVGREVETNRNSRHGSRLRVELVEVVVADVENPDLARDDHPIGRAWAPVTNGRDEAVRVRVDLGERSVSVHAPYEPVDADDVLGAVAHLDSIENAEVFRIDAVEE